MDFHKLANIFPLIEGIDFNNLVSDIKANGLHESIWVYDDKILDGRNRYRACEDAGVTPTYRTFNGDDPLGFVISLNLKRRHLNESQRAMVASSVANMNQGRPEKGSIDTIKVSDAASLLNVGTATVKRAKKVKEKATPEIVAAVEQGNVSVSVAASIADEPEEIQEQFIAEVEKGKKPSAAARTARRRHDEDKRLDTPKIEGKFQTIMVDPPWDHDSFSLAGRGQPNYSVLSQDDLLNGPESSDKWIPEWADEECHLYLWVTNNFLTRGVDLIRHWGFDYKTIITWTKPRFGMGSYFRSSTEHMLFATRGDTLTTRVNNIPTHFEAPLGKHSAKPDRAYEIAELASYPNRLEVFPGREREGWKRWGIPNE